MTFYECYEKRRDALFARLSSAKSLSEGAAALSDALDLVLSDFASGEKEEVCEAASYMVGAVKNALPLLECASETRLWERKTGGGEAKAKKWPAALCLCLGLALLAGVIYVFFAVNPEVKLESSSQLVLMGLGLALVFVSGLLFMRAPKRAGEKTLEQKVEVSLNAADASRRLSAVMLQIDKNLAAFKAARLSGSLRDEPLAPEELELVCSLLEGAYSEEGELASETRRELGLYLKRKGVELRDYEGGSADFELLPSESPATLRPALLYEGRLLKKGLAASGED
ncbi:MAG: hypothetical protein Q4B42_05495 [Oscillospiraceae bacterium]|nr:hypothetical protein [Oscillospiraceae bacterium]